MPVAPAEFARQLYCFEIEMGKGKRAGYLFEDSQNDAARRLYCDDDDGPD